MNVIDVTGLAKSFNGVVAVDHIALRVAAGEIVGFLGPNGSGKTTTIRMICGLLTPEAGEGTVLGFDVRRDSARIKREVGYMTQKFSLYEDLTIEENLFFVARLYHLADRRQVVARTLDQLGLTSRRRQAAGALSGGWKQRLALAACIMHRPKLLLLDEPTAGVDPKARRDFWDQIHALAAQGITVLVSTHYMDEAERCHELCYIAYGVVLARGTEAQIVEQSGLVVWAVQGADLAPLVEPLKAAPGVLSVAAFGNALHVAGQKAGAVEAAIAPWRMAPGLAWRRTDANLEDVFISLIAAAPDNFAHRAAA
jgi:ABC-2 type transport system ATP-binding protein